MKMQMTKAQNTMKNFLTLILMIMNKIKKLIKEKKVFKINTLENGEKYV